MATKILVMVFAARVAVMGHNNEKAGQADGAEYARAGIAPSITFGLDTHYACDFKSTTTSNLMTPLIQVFHNNPFAATNCKSGSKW